MKYQILILLISFSSFSQKKYLEEQEVIIVLYEDYKNQETKKVKWKHNTENTQKHHYWYSFYFNLVDAIKLSYGEYEDFDKQYYDQPMLYFKVNKSFLRKNKNIILNNEKIQKMGYDKTIKLLKKAKHILLIDNTETQNNKITIRQVSLLNPLDGNDVELPTIIYETKQ